LSRVFLRNSLDPHRFGIRLFTTSSTPSNRSMRERESGRTRKFMHSRFNTWIDRHDCFVINTTTL
jgi:hypothetical protein